MFSHIREVNPVLFPVGRICNEFNREAPQGVATYIMIDDENLTHEALITLQASMHCLKDPAILQLQLTQVHLVLGCRARNHHLL